MLTHTHLHIPVVIHTKKEAEKKAEKQRKVSLPLDGCVLSDKAKEKYEKDLEQTRNDIKTGDVAVYKTKADALHHLSHI